MNRKRTAWLCALIVLCVLYALYLDGRADAIEAFGLRREKTAAAIRYLPVYSALENAQVYGSFAIDPSNADMGFVAAIAKSKEPMKIKIVSESGKERLYNMPNTGEVAYYPLSDGDGLYRIQLLQRAVTGENSEIYEHVMQKSCEAHLLDEFQPYLRPSTYVWFTGYSDCVNAAATLCTGQSNDDRKIELVKNYVSEKLIYSEELAAGETQSYIRDPDAILARGGGICLDYAVLTAAMLRSQGIPTKVVYGSVAGAEGSLHAWNMVYTSSRGWFRVDVTYADKGVSNSFISDDANYSDSGWY